MTNSPKPEPQRSASLSQHTSTPTAPRRRRAPRAAAAAAAAVLMVTSLGGGPLVAVASAQSSGGVLQQSVGGGATVSPQQTKTSTKGAAAAGTTGATNLNPPPDFSGPGISKGLGLIGYAKAACLVIGVLTLSIGIPVSKSLKEAGNHNASGIRTGVISVGGSTLLAGVAGTVLPWLMA